MNSYKNLMNAASLANTIGMICLFLASVGTMLVGSAVLPLKTLMVITTVSLFVGVWCYIKAMKLKYLEYADRLAPASSDSDKFAVSGVWSHDAQGKIVDLRIENPRLAYRLLRGEPKILRRVERSINDGKIVSKTVYRIEEE